MSYMTKNARACSFCGKAYDSFKRACPRCKTPSVETTRSGGLTKLLSEADEKPFVRLSTGPWDKCFGPANGRDPDGIVHTGVTLIGGKAGGGKSTLSLQLSDAIAAKCKREVIYLCTEEDIPEVRMRAERIQIKNKHLIRGLTTLNGVEALAQLDSILNQYKPCAIILDSVVGLMGKDKVGAVELAKLLKGYSVKLQAPSIIIDHVTKADDFAGLEELQHTVDTTMTLFPSEHAPNIRILETLKNRFGQAFVRVLLEMTETGLRFVEEDEPDEGSVFDKTEMGQEE